MKYKKHFTPAEAESTLAEIIPLLERIKVLKEKMDEQGYDVYRHRYFGGMGPNGQKAFPNQLEELVELVATVNGNGIEIKDLNKGLIDFPAIRTTGEEVYLCFMLGEHAIEAWHPIEGGFSGRKPLSEF